MEDFKTQSREDINARFDQELIEFIEKAPIPAGPPIIPDGIVFPFMMVYHRKRVTASNNNYLVAVVIASIGDLSMCKRSLTHKGWPTMAMMFDVPEHMKDDPMQNRVLFHKFQNWDYLSSVLTEEEKQIIPDLKKMYPCPETQVKGKKGQYKLIF